MFFDEDRQIGLPVPFLRDKTVLYVRGRIGTSVHYIEKHRDDLGSRFEGAGYSFLFLPDLAGSLSPAVLHYMFPGQKDIPRAEDMYREIRDFAGLGDSAGFLYRLDGEIFFRVIPESSDEDAASAVYRLISYLELMRERQSGYFCYDEIDEKAVEHLVDHDDRDSIRFSIRGPEEPLDIREEHLDPRTRSIIYEWDRLAAKFGITVQDLEIILGYRVRLSRLYITTSNRIFLEDLDGRPEVKLDDLTKALYFFYLKHPQGAAFKELQSFENEILHIYLGITGRDDLDGIRKSVSALVSPYSDGRNSCVSRIKKAFRDIVGDHIARNYYIDGQYAGVRTVAIDRDLVIWEH